MAECYLHGSFPGGTYCPICERNVHVSVTAPGVIQTRWYVGSVFVRSYARYTLLNARFRRGAQGVHHRLGLGLEEGH